MTIFSNYFSYLVTISTSMLSAQKRTWKWVVCYETSSIYISVTRLDILKLWDHCIDYVIIQQIFTHSPISMEKSTALLHWFWAWLATAKWNVCESTVMPVLSLSVQKHLMFLLVTSTLRKICVRWPEWGMLKTPAPNPQSETQPPPPRWAQICWTTLGLPFCECENMFIVVCHPDCLVGVSYGNNHLLHSE